MDGLILLYNYLKFQYKILCSFTIYILYLILSYLSFYYFSCVFFHCNSFIFVHDIHYTTYLLNSLFTKNHNFISEELQERKKYLSHKDMIVIYFLSCNSSEILLNIMYSYLTQNCLLPIPNLSNFIQKYFLSEPIIFLLNYYLRSIFTKPCIT